MTDTEIFKEIEKQKNDFKSISYEDSPWRIRSSVSKIMDLLRKLIANCDDEHRKNQYVDLIKWLDSRHRNEITTAQDAWDASRKKNAAAVRIREYHSAINKATERVLSDLTSLDSIAEK